jgi:hypothetical protein
MLARIAVMKALNHHLGRVLNQRRQNQKPPSAGLFFVISELTCSANIQVNPRLSLRTQ